MNLFLNIIPIICFSFFGNYQIENNDKLGFDVNHFKIYNDLDNDGIIDSEDNCPNFYNPQQIDTNNNGIGDICDDELQDPYIIYFNIQEIPGTNEFRDFVNPFMNPTGSWFYYMFNQGYDIIDFDNDGKLDYVTMFYHTERPIGIARIGVFSFDITNEVVEISLNNVIEIKGEPNANAPEVGHFNNDDSLDIFIPTGNYHGDDNTQPPFYNGTHNRPDFLYYKNDNGFKIDSLDFTYNNQKYSNTSLQKPIQIDEDMSKEIAVLTYDKQMAFYDYDTEKGRHEFIREITTSEDKFNDVYNIHFDEDEFKDLITLSVSRGSTNTYRIHKYSGYENSMDQIDFSEKELIGEFSMGSDWSIAENEDMTNISKIGENNILFVRFHSSNNEFKLVSYNLSSPNTDDVTEYLFGKDFITKDYLGKGQYFQDIDNDGDSDLIVETLEHYNSNEQKIIFIQENGRFHPVKFNIDEIGYKGQYIFIDLNQDNLYDVVDVNSSRFYITNFITNVEDTAVPVITIEGESTVTLEVGTTYSDAGATAEDNYDGDITESIVTVNNVDTSVVGTYTVTYNVSDANGNVSVEVTRTVNVESSLSVDDNINNILKIYPNPVDDKLIIQGLQKKTKVSIYTILGKLVLSKMTSSEIDINNLKRGIYLIKFTDIRGQLVRRFIKK